MADQRNGGIIWCTETWNPIRARNRSGKQEGILPFGWHCERVSEACRNCYADAMNAMRGTGLPYARPSRDDVEIYLDEKTLLQPLHWRRPKKIFVCSMTDLFGEWVPDWMIDRIYAVTALCPQHIFQALTKRPERMRDYIITRGGDWGTYLPAALISVGLGARRGLAAKVCVSWPPPNVWLGVTVENQKAADERIPILIDTPAALRWISAEPLLGPIDLTFLRQPNDGGGQWWLDALRSDRGGWFSDEAATDPMDDELARYHIKGRLDWVVAGGESGPQARPTHPDWAWSLRDQCAAADVPFLWKQWGDWSSVNQPENGALVMESRPRHWFPDGKEHNAFPEVNT